MVARSHGLLRDDSSMEISETDPSAWMVKAIVTVQVPWNEWHACDGILGDSLCKGVSEASDATGTSRLRRSNRIRISS